MLFSIVSTTLVLYLLYLSFRKPQTTLRQTEDLTITATPLPDGDTGSLFGKKSFIAPGLSFLQGFVLESSHPYFGGWSGMTISENPSRLSAVSDTAHWLEANLVQQDGRLTRLDSARIGPLRDQQGVTLRDSGYGDIEAISMDDKQVYLAFESYRSGIWSAPRQTSLEHSGFSRWPAPADMAALPIGRGLEALSLVDDATQSPPLLLAIAERHYGNVTTHTPAWTLTQDRQVNSAFSLPVGDGYDLSDAAYHPQCGLFLLQRKLTGLGRFYVRLLKLAIPPSLSRPDATPPQRLFEASSAGMAIDNMEALAVVAHAAGECHIYLLSDSNFLPFQKTVLLIFGYRS